MTNEETRMILKEQSRPSVSNVTSADVSLTTTLSKGRHWLTSRNQSVNGTDWSTEIIQCNGRDSSFKGSVSSVSLNHFGSVIRYVY